MERSLILAQRAYWIILAVLVFVLALVNLDVLRSGVAIDLLFGKFTVRGIWFLLLALIVFLGQVLIARALLAVTRGRIEKLGQELAQVKASLFARAQERAERESPEPGAPPEEQR